MISITAPKSFASTNLVLSQLNSMLGIKLVFLDNKVDNKKSDHTYIGRDDIVLIERKTEEFKSNSLYYWEHDTLSLKKEYFETWRNGKMLADGRYSLPEKKTINWKVTTTYEKQEVFKIELYEDMLKEEIRISVTSKTKEQEIFDFLKQKLSK